MAGMGTAETHYTQPCCENTQGPENWGKAVQSQSAPEERAAQAWSNGWDVLHSLKHQRAEGQRLCYFSELMTFVSKEMCVVSDQDHYRLSIPEGRESQGVLPPCNFRLIAVVLRNGAE